MGLKEDKDPEELPCINDLTASLLCSPYLRGAHTLSLPRFCLKKPFSMCSPTWYAVSLIINFIPAFTVSASNVKTFFTGGKDPGKNSF